MVNLEENQALGDPLAGSIPPWQSLLGALARRWRLIALPTLLGLALASVWAYLSPPLYQAFATVIVRTNRARIAVSPDAQNTMTVERVDDQQVNSEVALMSSESLVREMLEPRRAEVERRSSGSGAVSAVFSILSMPFELPGQVYRSLHGIPEPNAFDTWVRDVSSGISVQPIPRSNLIQVSYVGTDPRETAGFLNAFVAKYLERNAKLGQQAEAREFYEEQSRLLADRARNAEQALTVFYANQGPDVAPEQREAVHRRLAETEDNLLKSETELAERTEKVAFLSREIQNHPKRITADAGGARGDGGALIKPRILELTMQRTELLSKYAPTSAKIQDIDRQIAEAKRLLQTEKQLITDTTTVANPTYQGIEARLAEAKSDQAAADGRVEKLRAQRAQQRARIAKLDELASTQERLGLELSASKESLNIYQKKGEAARFSSALDDSNILNVSVAEPAEVPTTPMNSKKALTPLLGGLFGLLLGMVAALWRDWLDPTVKGSADARRLTGLPVLGEVSS